MVELVVVILVMALLAAVGIVAFSQVTGNARVAAAKAELTTVAKAAVAELTTREASGFDAVWVTPLYAEVVTEVEAGATAAGVFTPLGPETPLTQDGQYGLAFKDLTGQVNATQGVGVTFATWVDGTVVSVSASAAGTIVDHEAENAAAWAGDALNTAVQERLNLATNPSFETTPGAFTLRANLASTPRITGYGYAWEGETLYGVPVGRRNNIATTIVVSPTQEWVQSWAASAGVIAVQPGETYTATYAASLKYVRGEKDADGRVQASPFVRFYATEGGAEVSRNALATATLNVETGDWALVTKTFTIPDGVAEMRVTLEFHNWLIASPAPEGSAQFVTDRAVTGALIEKGSQTYTSIEDFARAYFDGSYSPDPDLSPAWTGPVNASPSVLRGLAVTGAQSQARPPIASSQWSLSGQQSMRVLAAGTELYSFARLYGDSDVVGNTTNLLRPGRTYRVTGTAYLPAPQKGPLNPVGRARQLALYYNTQSGTDGAKVNMLTDIPNAAGEHPVTATFTVPASAGWAQLIAYHGAYAGNGDVWWDDLLVEDITDHVPADDSYFDGDTPSTSRSQYQWTGAPHASTSSAVVW